MSQWEKVNSEEQKKEIRVWEIFQSFDQKIIINISEEISSKLVRRKMLKLET